MIFTNQLKWEMNYIKFNKDYSIISASPSNGDWQDKGLHLWETLEGTDEVISISKPTKNVALLLIRKTPKGESFTRKLLEQPTLGPWSGFIYRKVEAMKALGQPMDFEKQTGGKPFYNLLLGAIKEPGWCCMGGEIYLPGPKATSKIREMWSISISSSGSLSVNLMALVPFDKTKVSANGKYYGSVVTGVYEAQSIGTRLYKVRNWRDPKVVKNLWTPGNYANSRVEAPFLDFSTPSKAEVSRVGILQKTLKDLQLTWGEYLNVDFTEWGPSVKADLSNSLTKEEDGLENGIFIADKRRIVNPETELGLQAIFKRHGVKIEPKSLYKVIIVDDKEEGVDDNYGQTPNEVRQHITHSMVSAMIESPENNAAKIEVLKRELMLKAHIFKGHSPTWKDLNLKKSYSFGIALKPRLSKKPPYIEGIFWTEIDPSGKMDFKMEYGDQEKTQAWAKAAWEMVSGPAKSIGGLETPEFFIKDSDGNENVIIRTDRTTTPDLEPLSKAIKATDPPMEKISIDAIMNLIRDLKNEYPSGRWESLIKKIQKDDYVHTKENLRKAIKESLGSATHERKTFDKFTIDKLNYRASFDKTKKSLNSIFESRFGLTIKEGEFGIEYVAGYSDSGNFQKGLSKGQPVRVWAKIKGESLFEELAPTFVNWIRFTGEYSVLPITAKYGKEALKIHHKEFTSNLMEISGMEKG